MFVSYVNVMRVNRKERFAIAESIQPGLMGLEIGEGVIEIEAEAVRVFADDGG